jgi:Predicted membrane protein
MKTDARTIIDSTEFQALTARKGLVSAILTVVMLGAYFGFVLTLAFDKALLSQLLADGLSLGIPVGLCIIFLAWALTGIYVYWANTTYDNAVQGLRDRLERSE